MISWDSFLDKAKGKLYFEWILEEDRILGMKQARDEFDKESIELSEEEDKIRERYEVANEEFRLMCIRKMAQSKPEVYEFMCRVWEVFQKYEMAGPGEEFRDSFALHFVKRPKVEFPHNYNGFDGRLLFNYGYDIPGRKRGISERSFCWHLKKRYSANYSIDEARRVGLINKALESFEDEFKRVVYYRKE